MNINILKNVAFFLILLLAQALVLNHIRLFDCAMPLLYVYFALPLRRGTPRWVVLLWCFAMGLGVDTFSNTPGVSTGAMTLVGFLQPYVLELFVTRESADDLLPSFRSLGFGKYIVYSLILVLVYILVYFTLEAFNFFNWLQWVECVGGSFALTYILILVIENLRRR